MSGLYASSVDADETVLYVKLREHSDIDEYSKHNNMMSIKIPLELNREVVEIERIVEVPNMNSQYIPSKELPTDYSKEQAINDNCFVIEDYKIISSNINQLDEFMQKTQEGINALIRIYDYNHYNGKRIIDIEYKDGKYITASKSAEQIYSFSGNNIEIVYNKLREWYEVVITDERIIEIEDEGIETNSSSQILTRFIK